MEINDYGAVFLTPAELFENIYTNKIKNFKNIDLDQSTVEQFNAAKNTNKDNFEFLSTYTDPELSIEEFDLVNKYNNEIIVKLYNEVVSLIGKKDKLSENFINIFLIIRIFFQLQETFI